MVALALENDRDSISLDGLIGGTNAVEALAGATGLGLPPIAPQWLEGAGDGALYRGRRVLPRVIDLTLYFESTDRVRLKSIVSRMWRMLADECRLRFIDDDGTSWLLNVVRSGGGDYSYGTDTTGEQDLMVTVTLTAGDPFWRAAEPTIVSITGASATVGLLPYLSELQVAPDIISAALAIEPLGDAPTWPTWRLGGPLTQFSSTSPGATRPDFVWRGVLGPSEKLVIDTRAGTVVDGAGVNRYAELDPAPSMLPIVPGQTGLQLSMSGNSSATTASCEWYDRLWAVV